MVKEFNKIPNSRKKSKNKLTKCMKENIKIKILIFLKMPIGEDQIENKINHFLKISIN